MAQVTFLDDDAMRNMYLDTFRSIEQWRRGETPEHVIRTQTVICDLPPIRS